MNDLSERARDLIQTVGDHDGPLQSDRERVRRTLLTALAGAGTTVAGSAGATAATQAGATLGSGALAGGAAKVSVTTALWLVGGGVAGFAVATPLAMYAASPQAISAPAPARVLSAQSWAPHHVAPAAQPPAPSPTIEPTALPPMQVGPEPTRRERAETAAAPEPEQALVPSVSAEVDLLKKAQRALSAGDATTALSLLDRHASQFPSGALAVERMAARVFALCELGRVDEARTGARAFLTAAPSSPLVPRVTASCAK